MEFGIVEIWWDAAKLSLTALTEVMKLILS
jgi:hypothetical protein